MKVSNQKMIWVFKALNGGNIELVFRELSELKRFLQFLAKQISNSDVKDIIEEFQNQTPHFNRRLIDWNFDERTKQVELKT